jgi:hypothetical protein
MNGISTVPIDRDELVQTGRRTLLASYSDLWLYLKITNRLWKMQRRGVKTELSSNPLQQQEQ